MDPIALAVPVFFLMIGVEYAWSRLRGVKVYRFADAVTCLSCGIGQQSVGVFVKLLVVLPYAWLFEHARVATLSGARWETHLVAFLGVDFAYYWWHRFTHETNVGWASHVVHHQSEDYNLAVALRQSATSSLTSWPFYLPLALVGVPPEVFLLHNALNTLGQFWIHTELIGKLGPLEWVLNTPSHHRVHHAINPQYLDKNYAGVLIVWDRMFGSFALEEERPVYGTVARLRSYDPWYANVDTLVHLVSDTFAARTWSDRARVWLARPGFRPAGLPPYPQAVPITPEQQVKYDPRGTPAVNAYVAAWFVPVALATVGLMVGGDGWTLGVLFALVAWTTWNFGLLFERKPWALASEAARLVAVAAAGSLALSAGQPWIGGIAIGVALASGAFLVALRPAVGPAAG